MGRDLGELRSYRQSSAFRDGWDKGKRLPQGRYNCKFREDGQWKQTVYTLQFLDDGKVSGTVHENVQDLVISYPSVPVPAPGNFEAELRHQLGRLGFDNLKEVSTCIRVADGALLAAAQSESGRGAGIVVEMKGPSDIIQ